MTDVHPNVTTASNGTINGTATTPIPPEGQILAYAAMYSMALACIFFGSFRSVAFVRRHQKEHKKIENSISFSDAKWFPITASGVLFGLYCLFKMDQLRHWVAFGVDKATPFLPEHVTLRLIKFVGNVSNATENATAIANKTNYVAELFSNKTGYELPTLTKEHFSYFLLVFFCYEGVFALAHIVKPFISFVLRLVFRNRIGLFQNRFYRLLFLHSKRELSSDAHALIEGEGNAKRKRTQSNVSEPSVDDGGKSEDKDHWDEDTGAFLDWNWDKDDVFSVIACAGVGICHVYKHHWITNNAFGVAFSLYGIEELHLGSFKAGVMLLAGLFVYDIFWVFATDVMTTVATSVNAPILLMFPQDILINGMKANKFAMLGLGDIVIPGIFLALLLRYGEKTKKRIYFYATLGAYGAGLLITIGVMHYFKAAQPALLYLVPTCVGAPLLLALIKGDWSTLVRFSEEHLVKQKDEDKKKAAAASTSNEKEKENESKKKQATTGGGGGGKPKKEKDNKKNK